jgi:hypothetical protein
LSFLTRLRRAPAAADPAPDGPPPDGPPPDGPPPDGPPPDGPLPDGPLGRTWPGPARGRRRRVASAVLTALAAVLVFTALVGPNQLIQVTHGAFLRLPLEAIVVAALFLVLPPKAGRALAIGVGVNLGVVAVVKVIDLGFYSFLARRFDLVHDWGLTPDAMSFLTDSIGRAGAVAVAVVAVLLIVAVLALMTLAVRRLARIVVRHDSVATRTVAVSAVAWGLLAVLSVEVVPGVPVAADNAATLVGDRALSVRDGLRDRETFAALAAADAFRDVPAEQLLTGLRGKDVVFAFVESYGRSAVEDPALAAGVGAVLDDGTRRLDAAGFASRSGWLTSPTVGSGSWLAHSTFLSGLWVGNEQRYRSLVSSDRQTLPSTFERAGWDTVAVMAGIVYAWPEGDFYGFNRLWDSRNMGYRGPRFSWAPMPDQYVLSTFERLERSRTNRAPLMVEMPLVSSHAPWAPLPRTIGWDEVGDGSIYTPMAAEGASPDEIWKSPARVRTQYGKSIEYTLTNLISYIEKYGDDDLVVVFLGDHQPVPVVTGEGVSKDVPITVVSRDPKVLDRMSGWGWDAGLKPGPQAPVWKMDSFRDRFLTTFR